MPQTDIRTLIKIENDRKGVDAAKQALKEVVKAQADLIGEFKAGGKSVEAFNDEMAKLVKQEKSLESAIDKATGEITAQRKEMAEAADEAARLAQEQAELSKRQAELSTPQGRFDKVSQDVALAGDTEGALRTLTGGLGAIGGDLGGRLEQGLNLGAEGFAALEALPKLKEAIKGIPDVANAAAQSLNTNVATMGALGAATIALGIALQVGQQAAEESRKAQQAQIDSLHIYTETLGESKQLTSEEIDAKLEEVRARKEVVSAQDETNKAIVTHLENSGALVRVLGETSAALGVGNQAFATARDNASSSAAEIGNLNFEEKALIEARMSAEVAANDAAEAERELANERTKSVLASANAAAALTQAEQATRDATQEQLDSLAESERDRIEVLKSQLEVLKNSGDTSEAVTSQIASLEEQLSTAEGRLKTFTSAVAKPADEAKKLSSALDQQASATERAASAATSAASAFDSAAANIAAGKNADGSYTLSGAVSLGAFAPKKTSTGSSAGSSAASDQQKAYQDYLDKQRDFFNEQQNILLDYHRSIEDIEQDFRYKQEDAASQRNFAAAAEAIRDQDRAIHDEKINTQRRLEDLANSQQQELQIYQSGQSAILAQTQQFVNQMSGQFSTLFNNIQNQQLQYVIG